MKKRILSILICLCILLGAAGCGREKVRQPIVILYENDVHCAVEGYAKLAALKAEMKESFPHVGVVSCGDFVQGGTLGAVSKGEYIIELMNKVGYDAIALGNHEFDYKLDRLHELCELSDTKFTSCNFTEIGKTESIFDPFTMVSYGDVEVAYIGVTTPETVHSSSPDQFQNEAGEMIYTFNEDTMYDTVQKSIDAAEKKGADIIIALTHIGYSEEGDWKDVTDLIENTEGLNVVLDAHTHTVMEKMELKDKKGNTVLLSSTGTKFANIGKLTITGDGVHTELIECESYAKTDATLDAAIAEINESYAKLGDRKIGKTDVALITHDDKDERIVRRGETNLGNLCSDALRIMTGADLSYVNGGGIRAPIEAGEITFNDIFSVFPFNNQVVTIEVTGQMLLDMLELCVMNYPEEDGSFPHMSGVTFSINTAIPSAVQLDKNGYFEKVDGKRRVHDVKILDGESGAYQPLKPDGKYELAGFNYHLTDNGGGMTMFKEATPLDVEGTLDVEMLENYITEHLNGDPSAKYGQTEHRITFTEE